MSLGVPPPQASRLNLCYSKLKPQRVRHVASCNEPGAGGQNDFFASNPFSAFTDKRPTSGSPTRFSTRSSLADPRSRAVAAETLCATGLAKWARIYQQRTSITSRWRATPSLTGYDNTEYGIDQAGLRGDGLLRQAETTMTPRAWTTPVTTSPGTRAGRPGPDVGHARDGKTPDLGMPALILSAAVPGRLSAVGAQLRKDGRPPSGIYCRALAAMRFSGDGKLARLIICQFFLTRSTRPTRARTRPR
jgi:hypothetical protein